MPKRILFFVALCVVSLGLTVTAFAGSAFPGDRAERMEAKELLAEIDSPDIVIIDVRRGSDFNGSELMIKNAVRKAYNDVDSWAKEYKKEQKIVLYCA